jgi:hypothetical protein
VHLALFCAACDARHRDLDAFSHIGAEWNEHTPTRTTTDFDYNNNDKRTKTVYRELPESALALLNTPNVPTS